MYDLTVDEMMDFEYEYNKIRDIEEGIGFWEVNAELQILANESNDFSEE